MSTDVRNSANTKRLFSFAAGWSATRLVALGMLLLQLVWVFAVPPFRGSDEFDHVYKAAAVARGDWIPAPSDATRGTGAWLDVPTDIVDAARPQCQDLVYTVDADCVGTSNGETTRVASGAGRYNPIYYAIVGIPALLFDGHAATYVMRLTSVLLCWFLFLGALFAVRLWARGAWPVIALAVAATPVLLYSSAVVAPNGVEMMSALAFWSCLIGLLHENSQPSKSRKLLLVSCTAGFLLLTVRSLGPLWALLAIVSVLIATGALTRWRTMLRRRSLMVLGGVLLGGAVLGSYWTLRMGSLNVGDQNRFSFSLTERMSLLLDDIPLWLLQSIAAFPLRNEPAPPLVYVVYLALFTGLFLIAMRTGGPLRWTLIASLFVSLAVPWLIAVSTYNTYPDVWQGRYGLPYSVGVAILAGAAIDERQTSISARLRLVGVILFVIGHIIGPWDVMHRSLSTPLSDFSKWIHPSFVVVAGMALVGAVLVGWHATVPRLRSTIHVPPG